MELLQYPNAKDIKLSSLSATVLNYFKNGQEAAKDCAQIILRMLAQYPVYILSLAILGLDLIIILVILTQHLAGLFIIATLH